MKVHTAHIGSIWRHSSPTYVASTLTFTSGHQINMNAIQFNSCKIFHLVPSGILIKEVEKNKISILHILNIVIANRLIFRL